MDEGKGKRQTKKKGEPRERKPNWREVYATVEEIKEFLSGRVLLRKNDILGQVEYRVPEPDAFSDRLDLPVSPEWQPIDDEVENTLYLQMKHERQQQGKDVNEKDMLNVIRSGYVPHFNPFRHYLSRLPPWDGQNHILAFSATVQVKADSPDAMQQEQWLFYQYLRKWLVGMVAGWLNARVVNETVLVLIGRQGSFKTTWFESLLPPELAPYFYTKTNSMELSRDDMLQLTRKALICCEELDTMKPRDLNRLKAAVTTKFVDERPAYGRHHEHRQHVASFCGTGNSMRFLNDQTGNRRWIPFEVESILSPRDHPVDHPNIFAEAYALYRQGFQYWFTQEDCERQALHNARFEVPQTERELIEDYFRLPEAGETGEFMATSIAKRIVGADYPDKRLSSVAMGRAFSELGFAHVQVDRQWGFIVVRLTLAERDQRRVEKARRAIAAGRTDTDAF